MRTKGAQTEHLVHRESGAGPGQVTGVFPFVLPLAVKDILDVGSSCRSYWHGLGWTSEGGQRDAGWEKGQKEQGPAQGHPKPILS